MIEIAMRCPCGSHPIIDTTEAYEMRDHYKCICLSCYDPTDNPGGRSEVVGYGATPELAVSDWWAQAEEVWEISYEPNALFAAISEQAGDEFDRIGLWEMTTSALHNGSYWYGPVETVETAP